MSGSFESLRWNACVHRLHLSLYSHPKEFGGMESEPMLTPREKSLLPEKFSPEENLKHDAASSRTTNPTHYQRAIPAPNHVTILTEFERPAYSTRGGPLITIRIALKGAIRDFLQSPQCAVNRLPTRKRKWPRRNRVQITCTTTIAYHVPHVVLRSAWYERTAQLLSLTELKSHLFELYFIC